jgi:hypothetical protein
VVVVGIVVEVVLVEVEVLVEVDVEVEALVDDDVVVEPVVVVVVPPEVDPEPLPLLRPRRGLQATSSPELVWLETDNVPPEQAT